jgi:hypothetical protein
MDGAISSYATTDIAFDFMGAHKLPHPATKRFRQGGDTIQGAKSSLTCSKVLHGADGFTTPSKEDELRIFIDLEIHRHWPGLNLRTLGPTASTLTVTPHDVWIFTYYVLSVSLSRSQKILSNDVTQVKMTLYRWWEFQEMRTFLTRERQSHVSDLHGISNGHKIIRA